MNQTLGVWLRQKREAKGSTVEDAARATRIRPRFLIMMEDGDFASFPGGELQIRGFLRVVSRYLELPADEVLARYDAEFRSILPEAEAEEPPQPDEAHTNGKSRGSWQPVTLRLSSWGGDRAGLSAGLVWGALFVVMIGVGASIAFLLTQGRGAESAASAALPTPIPTQSVGEPVILDQPTPETVAEPLDGVTVSLVPTEHVWVRVTVDNRIAHVGFLAPDELQTWSGEQRILIETGNGGGLEATVNERALGLLGERGAVVRRAFGPAGEIEPA